MKANDFFGIISAILSIAVLTLFLNKRSNTVDVIKETTSGFNQILNTLTLQGGSGSGRNAL